jgi:hypothetical protein
MFGFSRDQWLAFFGERIYFRALTFRKMGRQGSGCHFVGSCVGVNGYIDDGKALWRKRSSLDKATWQKHPHMRAQRLASQYFSGASTVSKFLWVSLPAAMRRLADGGAYNRIVGTCMSASAEGGIEGERPGSETAAILSPDWFDPQWLRNLDLNDGAGGPHRVVVGDLRVVGRATYKTPQHPRHPGENKQSVATMEKLVVACDYSISGLDQLMNELDLATGIPSDEKGGHFVTSHRMILDGVVRTHENWFPDDGSCDGWGAAWKARQSQELASLGGENPSEKVVLGGRKRPERRVRLWFHLATCVETEWNRKDQRYQARSGAHRDHDGFVTDWLVLKGNDVAPSYVVQGAKLELSLPEPGCPSEYVVFTAIEVAEKRGKHWVRLPWVCKMRVSETIDNEQFIIDNGQLIIDN